MTYCQQTVCDTAANRQSVTLLPTDQFVALLKTEQPVALLTIYQSTYDITISRSPPGMPAASLLAIVHWADVVIPEILKNNLYINYVPQTEAK